MDFGLSPDQIDLRDDVRRMARRDLAPGHLERAKSTEFPWEAYRRIARLGVLGLLAGETYLAFGLSEPHSGSDAAALRTTATADGDGYLLTGEKTSVTMLAHAEAMLVRP